MGGTAVIVRIFVSSASCTVRKLATKIFAIPPKSDETVDHHPNLPTDTSQITDTVGKKSISIAQKACVFALLEECVSVNHIINLTGPFSSTIY